MTAIFIYSKMNFMKRIQNYKNNVVVTGAGGGMGKKVCALLAENGYHVFALDINSPQFQNENITPISCDVTDADSLLTAKEKISAYGKLEAIINLAGVFSMESIVFGDEQKLRKIFEVNFWGVYLTNKIFFDILENKAKIVVMSSEVARYSPHPFDAYYTIPKKALDAYCDAFRRECLFLNIKVIKIQAGSFATNMPKKAAEEFETLKNNSPAFDEVLTAFDRFVGKELSKGKKTDVIAQLILKILQSPRPKICYRVHNSMKLKLINMLPEKTQDQLYKITAKLFGKSRKTKS